MSKNISNKLFKIVPSYFALFIIGALAKREIFGVSLDFLWLIYLPIATYITILTFDLLTRYIDFDIIHELKQDHKGPYLISLAVLSAGFAIATAIFMK